MSPDTILTGISFSILLDNVAIMSSASYPGSAIDGMFIASSTSKILGNWATSDSGISGRFALYSVYISLRKVFSGLSKATATCVGSCRSSMFRIVFIKPKTALVSSPFELTSGLLMKAKYDLYANA